MKANLLFALLASLSVTVAYSQDYWKQVPSFPKDCYASQDDFTIQVNKAADELKAQREAKSNALKEKAANMSKEEQMRIAMQYQNMSPDQIVQFQQEIQEIMAQQQTITEAGAEIVDRFNGLQTNYQETFQAKTGPLVEEARKLPDGEGTPDWAIEKAKALSEQYNKEYVTLCNQYLTGPSALFKGWLDDYKKYLIEEEIPYSKRYYAYQLKQAGLTGDESVVEMEAVGKYLDYEKTIYGMRQDRPH